MKRKERFVIVVPSRVFGVDSIVERYYQRLSDGKPMTTMSLKLARKWDIQSEAYSFCQALIKVDGWNTAYVGTA